MNKMSRSFYEASSPDEALKIYYENDSELYGKIKNMVIERILDRHYGTDWNNIKILEIGPGGGKWTGFFLKRGAQVTCVDRCENVLKGNAKLNPEAEFICGDIASVKLKAKYDMIFCKDVLEHIEDDEMILKRMFSNLNDGGMLFINTQNSFCLNYLLQGTYHKLKGTKNWYGWDPTHVRFYNPLSLKRKLKNCGFDIQKWFGSYYVPYKLFFDHSGMKVFKSKAMAFIEMLKLSDYLPLSVLAWNIGVIAKKRY